MSEWRLPFQSVYSSGIKIVFSLNGYVQKLKIIFIIANNKFIRIRNYKYIHNYLQVRISRILSNQKTFRTSIWIFLVLSLNISMMHLRPWGWKWRTDSPTSQPRSKVII